MGSYNDIADVKEHVGVIGGTSAWNDVVLASIEYQLLLGQSPSDSPPSR